MKIPPRIFSPDFGGKCRSINQNGVSLNCWNVGLWTQNIINFSSTCVSVAEVVVVVEVAVSEWHVWYTKVPITALSIMSKCCPLSSLQSVKVWKYLPLFLYRVSHETWQLVNGFECFLPYIILDIIDFFQFSSLTNSFTQIYFTLKSIFYKMTVMLYFLLFSFVFKNLTNYGRRHLKLFTNCHVSWDTL